ncbi:MAG TPA: type II toxin-antitoxin system PemK/MazF family toxin [Nitrospirota bacterium]|nr:type II toxin-antitoxin system PemK/MazF family toxin [Nitrospirota bacterium]
MNIKQGDVFWLDLADPDGSEPGYRHPHVVVQNNVYSQSRINTVVLCALTSNLKRASVPGNVLLKKGEANLKKESVVSVSQIVTVDKSDLLERIGSLSHARVTQIVAGVKLLVEPRDVPTIEE